MKTTLFPLLCALLLCGCSAQNPVSEPVSSLPVIAETVEPVRETPSMALLSQSPELEEYALSEAVASFLPMGDNLLFFSGGETAALTLVDPENAETLAVHEASIALTAENATVQLLENGISYFNGSARETVVLDSALREVRRISAPEDLTGMPLLSRDGKALYYCTADAVRCLDLGSGISQVLKEASHPVQSVTGLLLEDSVVQLSITDSDGVWRTLFLSAENGQLLGDYEGNLLPKTEGDAFLLFRKGGGMNTILVGRADTAPMVLNPLTQPQACFFGNNQVITAAWDGDIPRLEVYCLESGTCTSVLSGFAESLPQYLAPASHGRIWFLCEQEGGTPRLYRWDPAASQTNDPTVCISSYFTRENPDYDGLAACSLYAQEIGLKYGIEVLVYKDAVATEPWDFHLEYEYQASVLHRELEALDARLQNFPEGFLEALAHRFTALKICIVRSAVGSPESGSLAAVNGVQFWDDYDAYIVLATDHDTEYALYHELSHLLETVVLTESTAYDQWEKLNPEDFRYDYDYITNQNRDGSPWLQEGRESFIDTYSMSFPKEDRARILEYAMTEGHEDLFRAPRLQEKLRRICTGIRESFDLEDHPGTLLWEQYLITE